MGLEAVKYFPSTPSKRHGPLCSSAAREQCSLAACGHLVFKFMIPLRQNRNYTGIPSGGPTYVTLTRTLVRCTSEYLLGFFLAEGRKAAGLRWEEGNVLDCRKAVLSVACHFLAPASCTAQREEMETYLVTHKVQRVQAAKGNCPGAPSLRLPSAVSPLWAATSDPGSSLVRLMRISALNGFPSFWWKPSSHCSGS